MLVNTKFHVMQKNTTLNLIVTHQYALMLLVGSQRPKRGKSVLIKDILCYVSP